MRQVLPKPERLTNQLDQIIEGCKRQDANCQEQLYKYCYPEMIKTCYRYAPNADDAGTIFNNAMLKVFASLNRYREEGKLLGWVHTIVFNCCIDFVKSRHAFKQYPVTAITDMNLSIPEEVFSHLSAKEIRDIINQLPKATAVVLNLNLYEGCTHKQIADILGISEGTSKWHVNEGRRRLKKQIEALNQSTSNKNAAG